MSAYEVLELLSVYRMEAQAHVMNYVSGLFAFLVAGHLVADKLSDLQVTVITVLAYIVVPSVMVLGLMTHIVLLIQTRISRHAATA